MLQLIERYPTSTLLGRARPETLVRIPGVTTKTAETIIAAAKTSVASLTDPYTQLCIEAMASDLRQARERIEKHRRQIIAMMQDDPVIGIIASIPGIGNWSAICLRLELGYIERFHSFAALVRCRPPIPSSSKAEMASSAAGSACMYAGCPIGASILRIGSATSSVRRPWRNAQSVGGKTAPRYSLRKTLQKRSAPRLPREK
ncbi:MAG: hypothetical protein IPP94_18165 [Ignavibacteria bacterium]|nr:hypothetical protein [Ignavibacteria bacterium]